MYNTLEIASFIGAKTNNLKGREIDWLLTDSRSLCYPESTLFFAIKTDVGNGHLYINDLYQRGVRAFVVSEEVEGDFPEADFLFVQNTLFALQSLAAQHRSRFDIPIIGITGSNGKTVVKEWLYQLLAPDFTVTRSPRIILKLAYLYLYGDLMIIHRLESSKQLSQRRTRCWLWNAS